MFGNVWKSLEKLGKVWKSLENLGKVGNEEKLGKVGKSWKSWPDKWICLTMYIQFDLFHSSVAKIITKFRSGHPSGILPDSFCRH